MPIMTTLMLRVELAIQQDDADAIEEIKVEIFEAHDAADGNVHRAAELLGVDYSTLNKVTKKLDMKRDIALAYPGKGKPRPITVDGVTMTATDWAKSRGMNRTTILTRKSRGASDAEAVDPEDQRTK